ncbi:MAG: L-2-amino-thiazoline-4-carboxylic acid hydrolase [Alphaproteobacteria bacterium]|nr:L-2-amino-thiazoline-4-carboxylic acid hydrolase [Alphaproteobacteria bacterium]
MPTEQEAPISHLQRRKIEGRVLIPFIEACRERLGDEVTRDLVVTTIRRLAAEDGERWAKTFGPQVAGLRKVVEDVWASGGSQEISVTAETADRLEFNVTRCRYAEFYQELGLADLGALIHCSRDHAMIAGFNDDLELERTQTLMSGAPHCDFRFRRKS